MVVFTCNNCGESLKKKDVEKHTIIRCRGIPNLTCVDCLKDFRDDFAKHTVCVSEHQRYSAKGLNGGTPKTKQQVWVETVHIALGKAIDDGMPGITSSIRSLMLWLQDQASIPEKAKPFSNFVKNARVGEAYQNIDFVWKILEKARQELQAKLEAERQAEKKAKEELKKQQKKEEKKDSSSSDSSDSSDDESENKTGNSELPKQEVANGKKDKKKKRMVSESDSLLNGSSEFRKSKKSKKDAEEEESGNLNTALDACHLSGGSNVEDQKLSKKERKEKKKREKYEAEIMDIQSNITPEEGNCQETSQETNVEETEDKKSKKKKNKKNKNVEETPAVNDEPAGERKKKDKKNKKKNGDEEVEPMETDVVEKKPKGKSDTCKLNETLNMEELDSAKFSWDEAILGILESQGEISLKKLTKKVCNGYLATLGEYSEGDEFKALNKFNKKIHKMHNVLIHKEKVKLKTSRD